MQQTLFVAYAPSPQHLQLRHYVLVDIAGRIVIVICDRLTRASATSITIGDEFTDAAGTQLELTWTPGSRINPSIHPP